MDGPILSVLYDVNLLPVDRISKFFSLSTRAWQEYLINCSPGTARQLDVARKLQDDYRVIFNTLFDWSWFIEPGEYRYCNSGYHLLWNHNGACDICVRGLRWGDAMLEHTMLVEERDALALKRFRKGLQPVYWMKK